jgi:hypothetical protein
MPLSACFAKAPSKKKESVRNFIAENRGLFQDETK